MNENTELGKKNVFTLKTEKGRSQGSITEKTIMSFRGLVKTEQAR